MKAILRLQTTVRKSFRMLSRYDVSLMILFVGLAMFSTVFGCARGGSRTVIPRISNAPLVMEPTWHDSYEAAMSESASTGKPVLVNFTGSDWCKWCTKLKSDVFETDPFRQWAQKNVVLLTLDFPQKTQQNPEVQKQNAELQQRYGVNSFPSVLFLNSQGKVLGRLGYMSDPLDWTRKADDVLSIQSLSSS